MAIDRIPGARIPTVLPVEPATVGGSPAEAPIGTNAPPAANVGGPTVVEPSPLARVRAGDIGVEQYVASKVDAATLHLSTLAPTDLEFVRASLRARMMSDPDLQQLVEQASGVPLATKDG